LQKSKIHSFRNRNTRLVLICVFGFLYFCLFSAQLKAENTYGYCVVKDGRKGEDLFLLHNNVTFDSKIIDANFQQVLIRAWVKKIFVYDNQQILAKAKLTNQNGAVIGIALKDFTPYKFIEENDTSYVFDLSGVIPQSCINPASIVENDLNFLLSNAKQNEKIEYFSNHISKFNYQKEDFDSKYESFAVYEPNFILQKKEPRVIVIFYQSELIAIFYSRNVRAKLYDSIEMGKEYKLIYNSKFTEKTKAEMVEIFKRRMQEN